MSKSKAKRAPRKRAKPDLGHITADLRPLAAPIESLTVDPDNAMAHPPEQLARLKAIMARWGQREALVIDRDGIVRSGNARLLVARELGWSHVAVIRETDTPEEAIAFAIAANRASEGRRWNIAALSRQLDGLPEKLAEVTGFAAREIERLRRRLSPDQRLDVADVDRAPKKVALGECWTLGDHRLHCGDSTMLLDNLGPVDAVLSDPPYGMNYTQAASGAQAGMLAGQRRQARPILGDDAPFNPAPWCGRAREVLLWGADWFYSALPPGGSWVVWDKRASVAADAIPGAPFEVCWSKQRHARRFIRFAWGGWNSTEAGEAERWHPTQKPVPVMTDLLASIDADVVLDPFLGSGATLLAAESLGRRCIGVEIEPAYCDATIARWEKLTGQKAEKVTDGSA